MNATRVYQGDIRRLDRLMIINEMLKVRMPVFSILILLGYSTNAVDSTSLLKYEQ